MKRQAITDDAHNDAFDDQCLMLEIDFYGFEVLVFR
jgi:hypothetical protein